MTTAKKSTSNTKKSTTKTTKTSTAPKVEETPAKKRLTLADVPLNELVEVQSCFYGKLIYVSKKTGYQIDWGSFGTTQYISVDELMTMRNSQPMFFQNQWIRLIGDNADNAISFLQLERYYPKTADFGNFEDIFNNTPSKIKEIISTFNNSMKESFAKYAYSLVQEGKVDSIKKIEAVEHATGFAIKD